MDDLIEVCVGSRFRVSMTRHAAKAYDKAEDRWRFRCLKWMQFYADDGHEFLDDTKFRREGIFSSKRARVADPTIYVFKARHLRAYGGLVTGNHFVITEVVIDKKQDRADPKVLARAAEYLGDLIASGGREK